MCASSDLSALNLMQSIIFVLFFFLIFIQAAQPSFCEQINCKSEIELDNFYSNLVFIIYVVRKVLIWSSTINYTIF